MQAETSCIKCRYYRESRTCVAFPKGIPVAILSGDFDHRKPYKGDHGIQFKPIITRRK